MKTRTVAIVIVLLLTAAGAMAQTAVFEEVNGKVEIRRAGGSWEPASVGTQIDTDTTISTGFGGSATLALADSTLEVQQLTRMTLLKLVESSDQVETEMFLDVGRVKANVRTAERRQEFKVRSPVSTAAVRGTEFVYSGDTLNVDDGLVEFSNNIGQAVALLAGQQSTLQEGNAPRQPQDEAEARARTELPGGDVDAGQTESTVGSVTVQLSYPDSNN